MEQPTSGTTYLTKRERAVAAGLIIPRPALQDQYTTSQRSAIAVVENGIVTREISYGPSTEQPWSSLRGPCLKTDAFGVAAAEWGGWRPGTPDDGEEGFDYDDA